MNYTLRTCCFFVLMLFLCTKNSIAQNVDIHFNGFGFMDNREYSAFRERSRTYSGARAALDLGVNLDSVNHFRFGVNGIHEFGEKSFFSKADPIIYYNFTGKKGWTFDIGSFPRQDLITDYPIALLNDTLNYFRPNIQGLLTSYQSPWGKETIWIDWVSRQTNTDREQFIFGASGKYLPNPYGPFFLSHYFLLLHDAGAAVLLPNDFIRDNGGGQLRVGLDFSHKTFLDSLTIEAGGMLSLERTRGLDGFQIPKGFVAEINMSYKHFGLKDNFYAGQGHNITYGDSFYSKKLYNRLDLIYTPFIFNQIRGSFILSFHQSPGNLGDSQQAFKLSYDIGRKNLVRFKD
jgi:hypothetical protein